MLKYAALLFNTIALLIYQFFFADGVTITPNIPSSVKPESEFVVELTISKGATSGFAKLQQDLPAGFTATQDDNNGASFTFTNQSVKFIWMSLPSDKEFKVKYKVKVAAGISGPQNISGKFSFVSDNVKQSIEIPAVTVNVGDVAPLATNTNTADNTKAPDNTQNTTTTNNTTTATNNTTTPADTAGNKTAVAANNTSTTSPQTSNAPVSTGGTESTSITCTRNLPASAATDFIVELKINKGNVSGFAKLTETLPAGFTASAVESQGGSFTFADQKIKYVWVSMPATPEFTISYKVTVAPGISGNQSIDGVFSYIENDDTKKYTIPTSTITIGSGAVATNTVTATPDNTNTNTNVAPPDNNANAGNNNAAANNNTTGNNNAANIAATNIPAPQTNVVYSVQIAALRKAVDANELAARFKITEKINTEMAGGLTKYVTGSHSEYRNARDAREAIKNKGVQDAFVTAYNTGKRITVQEALMITSQKWYR